MHRVGKTSVVKNGEFGDIEQSATATLERGTDSYSPVVFDIAQLGYALEHFRPERTQYDCEGMALPPDFAAKRGQIFHTMKTGHILSDGFAVPHPGIGIAAIDIQGNVACF